MRLADERGNVVDATVWGSPASEINWQHLDTYEIYNAQAMPKDGKLSVNESSIIRKTGRMQEVNVPRGYNPVPWR